MLDQNTDRMWYVIGAVIVGAALIFIMNGTMPQVFASVGETFEHKAEDATAVVDTLSPYQMNLIDLETIEKGIWIDTVDGAVQDEFFGTYYTSTDYIPVVTGSTYRFTASYGLYNPRVVYYTVDHQYVSGVAKTDATFDYSDTVVPDGAAYVRISALDMSPTVSATWGQKSSPVESWRFFKVE